MPTVESKLKFYIGVIFIIDFKMRFPLHTLTIRNINNELQTLGEYVKNIQESIIMIIKQTFPNI